MKIAAVELSKTFNNHTILDKISFSVAPGEIFGIIGPNGSGKTTLLKLLNLLDTPSSGKILIDGVERRSEKSVINARRRMGLVFQDTSVFNVSVYENVAYGPRLRGFAGTELNDRVSSSLELVNLWNLRAKPASALSGGEVQRLALARVLATQPEILLLDEPTANADPRNVGVIEAVVRQVVREKEAGAILVTHNIYQARRLAHRTGLLIDGRFVEVADTNTLFSDPKEPSTRAFIEGDMIY